MRRLLATTVLTGVLAAAGAGAVGRDAVLATYADIAAAKRSDPLAEAGSAYDQLLAPGNAAGEALVMAGVTALIAQTRAIERAVTALGIGRLAFEGSDSLDDPEAVFQ